MRPAFCAMSTATLKITPMVISPAGTKNGATINHTTAICHLGGATLDNEENYLIKKLFTGGLGMVCVSNQARI